MSINEEPTKRVRKWQFMDDNGKVDGEVEIDDQAYEALLQGDMSERERQRIIDHYDRMAKWRFHHPQPSQDQEA